MAFRNLLSYVAVVATTAINGIVALDTTSYAAIPAPTVAFDYIVVGGGAAGIPVADKLSASGKSVLLLERGGASSYRWGGRIRPAWLENTNLTRFDVPGLDNELYAANGTVGVVCLDTDHTEGCILGGGTAVNAGLWWKPNPVDLDYNFPAGWKSKDMAAAISRVFSRIPGTEYPSLDGKIYYSEGQDLIGETLKLAGWDQIIANDVPDQKNHTFCHTPYMSSHGERGGPMATYLVSASARSNFKLAMNSTVTRLVRTGGEVVGVEVEAYGDGGISGYIKVTPRTGRVILSAGAFNTPKILWRSGIGTTDQLNIVKATDGAAMIDSRQWIKLPVGYNVNDNVGTGLGLIINGSVGFDFTAAYDTPNINDSSLYLDHRSGILTQSAPNIGPIIFDEILGDDGIVRQLSWTGYSGNDSMYIQQNLGRGASSRGRMTIEANLTTIVSTLPYLEDPNDLAAVIQGFENLQKALSVNPNITFIQPAPGTSAADFVKSVSIDGNRGANHWTGSAKMGTDDGRRTNGTSVVDTNTKVYGTTNLFVVDASIIPGQLSANPSCTIVTIAERAAELILALR